MLTIRQGLVLFCMFFASILQAASMSDSILEIPNGTIFELRNELEIPANRNFIELGRNRINESFNEVNQVLNQQHKHYYGSNNYYHYNDYLYEWQQTAEQSYRECEERHRVYYNDYYGNTSSNNSTIISRGNGNSNVIVNNQTYTEPTYGSYINDNSCIKPEHTIAILLLDVEESGDGGIFRDGYEFEVDSVRHRNQGSFHVVTIYFDHEIAKGIRIISSQSPELIRVNQLQYRKTGKGFWQGLGAGIAGMSDIGGNHFTIRLASTRYYD